MTKKKALQGSIPFILTLLLLNSSPAYAYLDPGTGSVILQGMIGAITAGAVVLRIYWHRLLHLLCIRKNSEKKQSINNIENK